MRYKSSVLVMALVLSLILNGTAAIYYYIHYKSVPSTHARQGTKRTPFLEGIAEEKRQAFLKQRRMNAPYFRDSSKKLAALHQDLLQLLSADSFSEPAYKSKLEEILSLQNTMQEKRIEPLITLAKTLSKEERQILVQQLERQYSYRNTKRNDNQQHRIKKTNAE